MLESTKSRVFAVLFCVACFCNVWILCNIYYTSKAQFMVDVSNKESVVGEPSSTVGTRYLEKIGELEYPFQFRGRSQILQTNDSNVRSNFPCIYGVYPIGGDGEEIISDDHKFACGIKAISGPPIVYSFGSHLQFDFELSVLKLRPDAIIFAFEINKAFIPASKPHPSITVLPLGLGGYSDKFTVPNAEVMSMRKIMKKLGHTHVDLLKMDVEGYEIPFVHFESDILHYVGQFLVEYHDLNTFQLFFPFEAISKLTQASSTFTYVHFMEIIEKGGLRLFYQEKNINKQHVPGICIVETSLIQKEWLSWDENKHSLQI